jgi:2-dehydropantoate 2-reductase
MRIAIVGAGAMGSLFGSFLADAGEDITLIDVWKEHVEAINTRGLKITGMGGEKSVEVRATTDPKAVGAVDLILIFVKSYNTAQAAREALSMAFDETVFLTLQNGFGNIEKIAKVAGKRRVVGGVTAHGSTVLGPGEIYHAGQGITVIGELDGTLTDRIRKMSDIFNAVGIDTQVSTNIQGALWSKVLVNVGINALTALTGLRNGELLEIPEIKSVMRQAVEEALRVAEALGVELELDDPVGKVYEVAEATATNQSSMLQDVVRRRRTEIDALNGVIMEFGKRLNVDTPINNVLTAAVRGLEWVHLRA